MNSPRKAFYSTLGFSLYCFSSLSSLSLFSSLCHIYTSEHAFPSHICMSVSRLVCTSRFSLKIELFEFRRFSKTCLDRYQQIIQVIANVHLSELKHFSLCDWKVWIQKFYSTQFPSLTLTSHFVPASAQHTQVAACQVCKWEMFAIFL